MPTQKVGPVSGKDPFYVIKFIELPNENTTEYVIVPESWIRLFCFGPASSVKEVFVAYPPHGSSESTLNRVIAKGSPEKEWSAYTGIIEFKADSYTEALAWSIIKNLNLPLMALDKDDIGDNSPVAALESSDSSRNPLSTSNPSKLQLQVPAVEINPSIADEGFRKIQPVKVTAAEYFDDALSSMAENYKPIIIETVQNTADYFDLSSSEDELIINEEDQNTQTRKKTANSDDIYGPATVQEIPNMSNLSCTSFEPPGKKPTSSVNLGEQGRMSNSTIARMAAPPRGHLHPSTSSSAVDQDHLGLRQDITEYQQPSVENDFDLSLFSSAYQRTTPSVPLFGSTGTNGKGTPPTAKKSKNFSHQFCLAQLPSLGLPTATNQKHDSLGTQQQMIDQRDTPNNENMKINNQNLHPQHMKNKKPADQYYVVQFKNVANLQTKYTCVRSCWITAITEYEVKIACPEDAIETQPNMFLLPIKLREEWRSYTAVVKYVTVSCNDAKSWIDRETKKCYKCVKNDAADTGGLPHKRAATSTADEVPQKKRLITVNASKSPQLPDISALSIIANNWSGENRHHQVKHTQTSVKPEPVPQSYPISAREFPPQMQAEYSSLPRYPTQILHPGFEHQYPPVCGQQHIQAHQSSSTQDVQTSKRSNPVNNTVDTYLQRNHQNTMCPQSYNLSTQWVPGHQYLPNQQRFSHDHNGQILTNTNMQISTRNRNDYPISHHTLMGPCHSYNGNYSAVAASHDRRTGVTGTAGLPPASRDPRLQPRVSGNSAQQNCNNTVSLYALEDSARPIAADNQPSLGSAANRNTAFQEFKIQCFKAFYKTANEYTTQYISSMLRATKNLCPQGCVAWNVILDEFQRVEAFRKEAHEYNKHYMVAMNNATIFLCNNINGYFIH